MSWTMVRTALATQVNTISGLKVQSVVKSPSPATDSNIAIVLPAMGTMREKAGHAMYWYYARVVVQCQRGALDDQQKALDAYLDPTGAKSVEEAVMADPTLGGEVEDTEFLSVNGYGMADNGYMQADLNFRCLVEI